MKLPQFTSVIALPCLTGRWHLVWLQNVLGLMVAAHPPLPVILGKSQIPVITKLPSGKAPR